jgi:hypothetical protein
LELAKELELDRALYSRNEPWVQDCLAMIVGRVIYAGSKLALSNQWKNTALWELCGVAGRVDVEDHCYLPMDRLLERQRAIQRTLASKHLKNGVSGGMKVPKTRRFEILSSSLGIFFGCSH